ncbi:hypothetical protein BBD42_24795 [Paenibacillus sp. BIHB 4019]|uniref:DUF5060 domain-containing protein n=1 Tax=Paenibacillus sp. BIHB 4019 TaxID=1870819 RepID=A0A1B2DNQ7_9BACL|nr:DUF5060 domain-containing protein [Paenibacillus sp. BIHB 4019]ANY69343.1 hypothetical protein BBD42_24795 [Paenibacillus sp. BIHB 4019]
MKFIESVEQWNIFEIELQASHTFNNPFKDVNLYGEFWNGKESKQMRGFHDGGSTWKLRFMPESQGEYRFRLYSDYGNFEGLEGSFVVAAPSPGNHGPIQVTGTHFSYADGNPFFVMGTTAYAWTYLPEENRLRTLDSFQKYGFNKIRMLVFPKYMRGRGENKEFEISYEPSVFPFEGEPNSFDFQRFCPGYFQNLEDRIMDLLKLGIEADVILFHPYDCWGIDAGMQQDDQLLYINYLIARLSAYRNVWWSLANEFDVDKTPEGKTCVRMDRKDWDLFGATIKANDPHSHLISIHNIPFGFIYPNRDWMTHVSYQHPDTYTLALELKNRYKKPIVNDEYQYEGNIKEEWGNNDSETTVFRHWLSVMAGSYATHGEVIQLNDNEQDLFWAYGGTLIGKSAPRLKFMKQILETCQFQYMERDPLNTEGHHYFTLHRDMKEYLIFCRYDLPGKGLWCGPFDGTELEYEAITYDAWNCKEMGRENVTNTRSLPIKAWTVYHLKYVGQ